MNDLEQQIKATIRDIPDFPKPGIVFKDITPLLGDVKLSKSITNSLYEYWKSFDIEAVVGIESRGFMWGHSMAQMLEVPFVPIRKKGKLPAPSHSFKYALEYGSAEIEIHKDAIKEGQRVLVHDDLLATGGTAIGGAELIKLSQGIVVGFSFVVELSFLEGRNSILKVCDHIHSLSTY